MGADSFLGAHARRRYAPASRLRYADEVATPALIKDFGRKLQLIAEHEVAIGFGHVIALKKRHRFS
jgi:hypothetical protein